MNPSENTAGIVTPAPSGMTRQMILAAHHIVLGDGRRLDAAGQPDAGSPMAAAVEASTAAPLLWSKQEGRASAPLL